MTRTTITLLLALTLVGAACGTDSTTTTDTASGADADTTQVTETTTISPQDASEPEPAQGSDSDSVEASASDDCPDDSFLVEEVDSYEQSGGYPDPVLSVECIGDVLVVESNNIPTFEFVSMTPNGLSAQDNVYEIPLEPVEADTPGAMGLGAVGVTVTGLDVFAAFEAPQDGFQDPFLDGLLDYCNGHTAQGGQYHFHARMDCLFDDPTTVGLVMGYAFDGYEMLSPWVCVDDACTETRMVTSSYVRIDDDDLNAFEAWEYQDGAGDLDECNGMVGADGEYHYYITDEFPYVPFCYHGETDRAQGDFDGEAPAGGRL